MWQAIVIGLGVALPLAAAAEEAEPIARGTDRLVAVPFLAENHGDGPLVCTVALAHWYSADLGRADPGGRVESTFWYDPHDGSLLMLNAMQDHMPVQALWCGSPGQAWTTGTRIDVARKVGEVPPAIRLACAGRDLACR